MENGTQLYLLALDVFTLAALAIALTPAMGLTRSIRDRLLQALVSLAILRSSLLVLFLSGLDLSKHLAWSIEVLSLICIIWALFNPSPRRSSLWQFYGWLGLRLAVIAILWFWLVASWPWPILATIIAFGGMPLVFSRVNPFSWLRISLLFLLGLAATFNWLALTGTGQFISLIGYGLFVYTIFSEAFFNADQRQQEVEALSAEARRNYLERARFIDISNTLNAIAQPGQLLEHAVRTLGQTTLVDQAVILATDPTEGSRGHVAAVYHAKKPTPYFAHREKPFTVSEIPLLVEALERKEQLTIPAAAQYPQLTSLYALWNETEIGPTFIQPLRLKQRVAGFLILGNPISKQLVRSVHIRTCLNLGPQLTTMVIYHQAYQILQDEAEDLADRLQTTKGKHHQFANIIEAISDGVVVSDPEGKIKLVNKAAERLLDRSKDKLMGQPFGLIYGEIDSQESIEKLATEFSRGSQALPTYFERNGLAIKGQLIPLRNHRQEWMGLVALLRDVTAEVGADRAKSQFINTISKEIRSPLTTMKGYLDLVLHGAAGNLEPEQQQYLNLIKVGTDQVAETISNALLAVEDKTDPIKLEVREIDVEQLIRAAVEASSAAIEAKSLKLNLHIAPDLLPIQADETRLKQVLNNLLSNACRFTQEKGEIAVRAWIQWEGTNGQRAKFLIIAIADSGVGIPLEEQRHIFDPYYQIPNDINNRSGGIGLGLSIVKELVEAHGGRVWVESSEGQGSIFQVALPIA